MKLLFAHDHKFRFDGISYYSTGGLSNEVLSRYVSIFGEVDVIARSIPDLDNNTNLSKITNPYVTIYDIKQKTDIIDRLVLKSDCIIARLPSLIGNKVLKAAIKYNKPYLIELVGCPWDSFRFHSIKGKMVAPYMYFITKAYIKKSNWVIYVTKEFLQNRYPNSNNTESCSDVVLNDKSMTDEMLINQITKLKNSINSRKLTLGTIGSVDISYKGQQFVIEAIKKLNDAGISVTYDLVGGGNPEKLKNIVKKLELKDSVRFLGTIPHNDIFNWLSKIDIYIQPSLTEGLPRSVLEAMSRGCIVLGSNVGGIPELIDEPYCFKPGNYKEIANLIMNLSESDVNQIYDNYKKLENYKKDLLDLRRLEFYRKYASSVNKLERG